MVAVAANDVEETKLGEDLGSICNEEMERAAHAMMEIRKSIIKV